MQNITFFIPDTYKLQTFNMWKQTSTRYSITQSFPFDHLFHFMYKTDLKWELTVRLTAGCLLSQVACQSQGYQARPMPLAARVFQQQTWPIIDIFQRKIVVDSIDWRSLNKERHDWFCQVNVCKCRQISVLFLFAYFTVKSDSWTVWIFTSTKAEKLLPTHH